jgi:hypothetical protein
LSFFWFNFIPSAKSMDSHKISKIIMSARFSQTKSTSTVLKEISLEQQLKK